MNFKNKLIATIALVQASVLIFYVAYNHRLLENAQLQQLEARAKNVATLLSNLLTTPIITSDIATIENITKDVTSKNDIEFMNVMDSRNVALLSVGTKTRPEEILTIRKPIGDPDLIVGHIEVGFSHAVAQTELDKALTQEIKIAFLALATTLLSAFFLGTLLTRRLKTLEQGAIQIQNGDLGTQIENRSNDEIGRTASAFNAMSQHIEELYSEQHRVNTLLSTLNAVQTKYIQSSNQTKIFDDLLHEILQITQSEYGFLGEVLEDENKQQYLHTYSITDISWDEESSIFYNDHKASGLNLYDLDTLYGAAIKTGLPVISNDPAKDKRSGGNPKGHPALDNFLGMPLYSGDKLVGMIGVANRKGGYNQQLVENMNALWQASASIISAYANEKNRRKIEQELRESEERFSLVAQGTNDGMWDWDLRTGKIYYSNRWREMLGYDEKTITNKFEDWQDIIHSDDLAIALEIWTKCMEGELDKFSFEYRIKHSDGDYRWILCRGTVFKDKTNRASRMAGSHTDINQQKENEISLKESAQRTQAIFDNVSDTILTLDEKGIIQECNPAIKQSYKYTSDEVIGKHISSLVDIPRGSSQSASNIKRIFQLERENNGIIKNGGTFPIDVEVNQINDEGRGSSLILVIRDITERKKTENAIRRAHEAALDAAKTKSEFLANMSHEIRTPLHGIIGTLQLTENTELDDKQQNYISTAAKSATHLLDIINDILDISKLESGKFELESEPFNLREILEDVTRLYAPQALKKNLLLEHLMSADLEDHYRGDAARLKQVFNNLVSNAIKFTSKGSVLINVDSISRMGRDVILRIEIADTGIGISKESQSRIFETFQQADSSMARRHGGTGLGLAICKQLTELMNGELNVESEQGKGSRFIITLPLQVLENKPQLDASPLHNKHALLLDINNSNLITSRVIEDHLQHWHLDVTHCDDINEIISIINLDETIDYLFLYDEQITTAKEQDLFREIDKLTTIIYICKTDGIRTKTTDRQNICQIEKPIKHSEIYNALIGRIAEELKVYSYKTSDKTETVKISGNALLVEDNPVNQEVSGELLKQLGLKVEIAENGLEAVEAVKKKHYDIILMDCQMPIMDGFEATIEIRKLESESAQKRHIIIALTANAMKGDREKCLAVGMDDYLAKPFTSATLTQTIGRWISSTSRTSKLKPSISTNDTKQYDQNIEEIVDQNIIEALRGIMKDRFPGMVEKFENNAKTLMEEMRISLKERDFATLRRAAHTLKGSSGTLGAIKLQQACLLLEDAAKNGDKENLKELVATVETEFGRFQQYLPKLKAA